MKNVLSIDFESWVHRDQIENEATRRKLDDGFISRAAHAILELLEKHQTKTTFFIVGEIFDWYPEIVYQIRSKGHEVAYHTHSHVLLRNRKQLLEELKKSRPFINEFGPKGFRATKIFLKREYLSILLDHGFTYDSSVYGSPKTRKTVDGVLEIPVTSIRFHRRSVLHFPHDLASSLTALEIPIGSGIFLGLLGNKISHLIVRMNKNDLPVIMFVHPWQLFGTPRRISLRNLNVVPYYVNCYRTVEMLLKRFEFTTMEELLPG